MKLLLTRHGETLENRAGLLQGHNEGTLSQKGIEQAKKLALRLKTESLDIIYCSNLGRAVNTAKEISVFHQATEIVYTNRIRERNFGEFQGRKRDEVGWSLKSKDSKFPCPKEGETEADVYKRAKKFLEFVFENHPDKKVLLVCHGYIGKVINGILSNKSIEDISAGASLKNTSLSVYSTINGRLEADLIDDISHLEETN